MGWLFLVIVFVILFSCASHCVSCDGYYDEEYYWEEVDFEDE
jgi:hypothetical protein